jgi:hypothetical protein
MKRFLLVLALVAVAGATYVATAPGSQTAAPTARQFAALKKQVAKLQKDEKKVKGVAYAAGAIILDCMAHSVPIKQFGDPGGTYGYAYTDASMTPGLRTALDLTTNNDASGLWITYGTSKCGTDINASLRKVSRFAAALRH